MKTNEIYQSVTDKIMDLLENHSQNWNRPWIAFGQDNDYARNAKTNIYYRGINQFLLGLTLTAKGYFKNQWLTFKQTKDLGGFVKKGEKSTPIIFTKPAYIGEDKKYYTPEKVANLSRDEQQKQGIKRIFVLKLFRVFNVAQTVGLDAAYYEVQTQESLADFEKDERAEKLILSTNASIEITKSNRAYYDALTDSIKLPLREQFKDKEPFYGTALHELGHWTGHSSRLNRDLSGVFGEASYAKEELIAELTSAFCCASLGFSKTITNNAAYLKNWLGILKEDNKAIVRAAQKAQKAADYILAFDSKNNESEMEVTP